MDTLYISYLVCIVSLLILKPENVYSQDGLAGLGDLAKMFAMMSGGDECKLTCPKSIEPTANPKHKPSSNGCGSFGFKFDVSKFPGFTSCCDAHDMCYDTCNNKRNDCDEDFKECLNNSCHMEGIKEKHHKKLHEACGQTADMMHSGTVGLGCAAFKESQRNACLCNGKKLSEKDVKKYHKY